MSSMYFYFHSEYLIVLEKALKPKKLFVPIHYPNLRAHNILESHIPIPVVSRGTGNFGGSLLPPAFTRRPGRKEREPIINFSSCLNFSDLGMQ